MKKLIACFCLLLLTSCIYVTNFGRYWDMGLIDPRLKGVWENIQPDAKSDNFKFLEFQLEGNKYHVTTQVNRKENHYYVKSVKAGEQGRLMLVKPVGFRKGNVMEMSFGGVIKYRMTENTLELLSMNNPKGIEYVKKNYPSEVLNMMTQDEKSFQIKVLSSRVIKIFTVAPDDVFTVMASFKKAQN